MDDQVAKHIKTMLRRVMRKAPGNNKEEFPLHQAVQALKRGADYPYNLLCLARSTWSDDGSKT
jgi:hypothetical protein